MTGGRDIVGDPEILRGISHNNEEKSIARVIMARGSISANKAPIQNTTAVINAVHGTQFSANLDLFSS
jgi:hypothetical protein